MCNLKATFRLLFPLFAKVLVCTYFETHHGLVTKAAEVAGSHTMSSSAEETSRQGTHFDSRTENYRRNLPVRSTRLHVNKASSNRATILSIGDDGRLLETRRMVFFSAGYAVHSVSSAVLLDNHVVQHFDAAVICHSVLPKRVTQVAEFLHNIDPALPILDLGPFRTGSESKYHVTLQFPPKPEVLLETLEKMLSGQCSRELVMRLEKPGLPHQWI